MKRNLQLASAVALALTVCCTPAFAQQPADAPAELPLVTGVEAQPLAVQVRRLIEATDYLGMPLANADKRRLNAALDQQDNDALVQQVQQVLDKYCLAGVSINPESRVKVARGPAKAELDEQGWRQFLIKVHNEAGVTAKLEAQSPQARPIAGSPPDQVRDRWMQLQMFDSRPLEPTLSGQVLEYRIIQLYSRDAGQRSAVIAFNVGQGTQDIGFRNDVPITFTAHPSTAVTFRVKDVDGEGTMACFEVRDKFGRVYPSQAKRIAPDFHFHPQVYRGDGEQVRLPAGEYNVRITRGPEYVPQFAKLTVGDQPSDFKVELKRWADPAARGWWSGDHHIHAAGCAHYNNPSEGVHAPDMARHCMGEDLKVGANLTWGPCFDYQKQFFTGRIDGVSKYPYLLRYDVEVSGFGSHRSGHLCLLRLKQQIPPGGESSAHWPTLCLNTLRWAQKQGAVAGPAHSGWGLQVPGTDLPNYNIPPFDGIGACEYIVDVTHMVEGPNGTTVPAVDFISLVDTPYVWEVNIWYHTLNCGFRTRVSGETDFPCIYGERVGLGRSYVKVDGKLDYDAWCQGIADGRCYVSDGLSHLMDMKVNGVELGTNGSEVKLDSPGKVRVTAIVSARLNEQPNDAIRGQNYTQKPYWHLERSRIGDTRTVPVELIVNGYPVARKQIVADGREQELSFDADIERSSWVAMRILPSSHTNPVFVLVGDKPIRASKRSAEWCLRSVQQCWSQKERFIDADEMEDAKAAYAHAREVYERILNESEVE